MVPIFWPQIEVRASWLWVVPRPWMFTGRHVACGTGVKCHPDRRSQRLLLGVSDGWIKGSSMSSFSTNRCSGISPQGQELRRVEAAYTPVKGVQKKCSNDKIENMSEANMTLLLVGETVMCFGLGLKDNSPSPPHALNLHLWVFPLPLLASFVTFHVHIPVFL